MVNIELIDDKFEITNSMVLINFAILLHEQESDFILNCFSLFDFNTVIAHKYYLIYTNDIIVFHSIIFATHLMYLYILVPNELTSLYNTPILIICVLRHCE